MVVEKALVKPMVARVGVQMVVIDVSVRGHNTADIILKGYVAGSDAASVAIGDDVRSSDCSGG